MEEDCLKNVMPKDGKNSFSCPLPCPALYATTAYFPMPQVNITPTFCGFTRHLCSSEILPFFLWIMHICQYGKEESHLDATITVN
jgi:hypothetical protein